MTHAAQNGVLVEPKTPEILAFNSVTEYGPDAYIPLADLDRLISECTRVETAELIGAAGWLSVEQALIFASGGKSVKRDQALEAATRFFLASSDPDALTDYDRSRVGTLQRNRHALLALPLYKAFALNQEVSLGMIHEYQAETAQDARQLLLDAHESRIAQDERAATHFDGMVGELLIRMGLNRVPILGRGGVAGFAIDTTFRQDRAPYSKKEKYAAIHAGQEPLKRNWDISLIIRNTEHDPGLAALIGWLGQTAVPQSGLCIGSESLWRYAAKLQVKSKVNILTHLGRQETEANRRTFTRTGNGTRDRVTRSIQDNALRSVTGTSDTSKVTVFGMTEELDLTTPKDREEMLELLIADALGSRLERSEANHVNKFSKRIKERLKSKIAVQAAA